MVWRTRQEESPDSPASGISKLIAQLEAGSATAETRVAAAFNTADELESGEILNELATSAAAGSPFSLELLLGLMTDNRLAAPAISRHIKDPVLVEEVEQEVMIAVARSIHRYRSEAKFTTWLYSLARNTAISEIRRQRPSSDIDEQTDDWNQRRVSSLVAERDMLREAVHSLPPVFRETVLLRDVERLSYSEIAERQGLAINTVRSRLSRGRALLAALLPDQQSD